MTSSSGFVPRTPTGLPDLPPPPPLTTQWDAPTSTPAGAGSGSGESSTKDVAKDQAASVAGGAKDAAKNVAGTAKDQAAQVAGEAKKQVGDLVGQARSELTDQAGTQQARAASGLKSVSEQLRALANGESPQGPATDLAHQAADKVGEFAGFLENRDPGQLLDEVRRYAQRRPGMFLAVALGAGIVAGRLTRGLTAANSDSTATGPSTGGTASLGGTPRPALGTDSSGQTGWSDPGVRQ